MATSLEAGTEGATGTGDASKHGTDTRPSYSIFTTVVLAFGCSNAVHMFRYLTAASRIVTNSEWPS